MTDRATALRVLEALARTPIGGEAVLVGLLVIAEQAGNARFAAGLTRLFQAVDPIRLEDVRAGAQDALLALARDPTFADAGAEGYASALREAERGLASLMTILEAIHG